MSLILAASDDCRLFHLIDPFYIFVFGVAPVLSSLRRRAGDNSTDGGSISFLNTRIFATPLPDWPPRHGTCLHAIHGHQSSKNRHFTTDSNRIAPDLLAVWLVQGWHAHALSNDWQCKRKKTQTYHRASPTSRFSTKTVFILQDFAAVRASIWLLNKIYKYQRSNGHDQMTKYLFLAQWHDSPTRKDLRHRIRARRTDSS